MIAISLLDTDILRLAEKADEALTAGVDFIYLDFAHMDVFPETMAPSLCQSLRSHGVNCPIEVRLPRNITLNAIVPICQSGADWISLEPEIKDLNNALELLGGSCKKGFVISSDTDINHYIGFLHKIDYLVFQLDGQLDNSGELTNTLITEIMEMKKLVEDYNCDIQFSITGRLSQDLIRPLHSAGIGRFVIGREMLDSEDYYSLIAGIRKKTKSA